MENAFFGNVMNKKEKAILRLLYDKCTKNNGSCILAPLEMLVAIPLDIELRREELEPVLKVLETDEYFDMTVSTRKGEKVYCFTLKHKGLNIKREEQKARQSVANKILLALLGATVTFLAGRLLLFIFG
jgi:hypothetical protein